MVESQVKQLIFIFLLYLYNLTLCSHFNDWNLWLNINPFCSKTILTSPTTVYTPKKGFSCPFLLRKNKTKKPVKLCPYSHWTIYTTSSSVFFSYIFSCHLVNCGPSHSPSMSWHPSLSPQKTHPALGPPASYLCCRCVFFRDSAYMANKTHVFFSKEVVAKSYTQS